MRILVHTIFYAPDLTGIAKYTAELCEWLARRGHRVSVIAPPPYYPQWRVKPEYNAWRYATENLNGVRVHRTPIWVPRRPSGMKRLLHSLSFALTSVPVLIRETIQAPDVIFVVEPSFVNAFLALPAAAICGARAWLHIQDFEIDLAYNLGQLRAARRLTERVERAILNRFDVISSISRRLLTRAREKGVLCDKLFLLPNWFESSAIRPLASPLRDELGIPADTLVALFAGTLGVKQGVETIIKAARLLENHPRLLFVICGEGPSGEELQKQSAGLNNVRFLPLFPANRLNDLLNLADIHLLTQVAAAADSVLPSKLIGMMASGKPVVAAARAHGEIADLIDGCGLLVAPNHVEDFAAAVLTLAANPIERIHRGQVARRRALEFFEQESILTNFERYLEARLSQVAAANLTSQ